jgi:hypothetical protein
LPAYRLFAPSYIQLDQKVLSDFLKIGYEERACELAVYIVENKAPSGRRLSASA